MATNSGKSDSSAQTEPLPLFFRLPYPITLERHRNAGLQPQSGFSFAKDTNSIPINLPEFAEIARSYPIVFSGEKDATPVALVGLENTNLFVEADGSWSNGFYVPAYVRKYPFTLLELSDQEQWILCVDEAAPAFTPADPAQAFYSGEEASEFSKFAISFCTTFQQHHKLSQEFVASLEAEGLLMERVSTLSLNDGKQFRLRGFKTIDEEKLATLSDETLLEWRKRGWLLLIDAVILSGVNWKYLGDRMALARTQAEKPSN